MFDRRSVFALTGASLIAAATTGPARASESAAVALITSVTEQLLALVTQPGSRESKEAAFRQLMEQNSDLRQIAGFTVGRYARSMNPQQRDRFVDAFSNFITRTYVARFDEYNGENIRIGNVRDGGSAGYLVESQVERVGEPPLKVAWLVSDRSGAPKVADIQVEGISMAQSQRSEFTSMIAERNGDIERFIADLEARASS